MQQVEIRSADLSMCNILSLAQMEQGRKVQLCFVRLFPSRWDLSKALSPHHQSKKTDTVKLQIFVELTFMDLYIWAHSVELKFMDFAILSVKHM